MSSPPPSAKRWTTVRGARDVAGRALCFGQPSAELLPVVANGRVGVVATVGDRRVSLMLFTVVGGRIVAIDAMTNPDHLERLVIAES